MLRGLLRVALSSLSRRLLQATSAVAAAIALSHCGGDVVLGELDATGFAGGPPVAPESCDFSPFDASAPHNSFPLLFATFWDAGADDQAVKVLQARADEGPFDLSVNTNLGRSEQLGDLKTQLEDDYETVPDVFQVNGGADVLQWVQSMGEGSEVCALDELDPQGFRGRYFKSVLQPVTCRGALFALPIGVHRVNGLFVNPQLLALVEEARGSSRSMADVLVTLDTPESFADYVEEVSQLGLLGVSGDPLIPLAVGNEGSMPIGVLAFDSLMSSIDGLYEAIWMGEFLGDTAKGEVAPGVTLHQALKRWLSLVDRLVAQSNPGRAISWRKALDDVARGNALFSIMGDWGMADVALSSPEGSIESGAFPPSRQTFIYTPDSIAVPRVERSTGAAARYFLTEIVDDKETLLRFAQAKFATPPRSDLTSSDLDMLMDPRLVENYRSFQRCDRGEDDCRLMLAVSGFDPPPFRDPCYDEIWELVALSAWGKAGAVHPAVVLPDGEDASARSSARDQVCDRPFPTDPKAAGEEAINRLIALSERQPYVQGCGEGTGTDQSTQ